LAGAAARAVDVDDLEAARPTFPYCSVVWTPKHGARAAQLLLRVVDANGAAPQAEPSGTRWLRAVAPTLAPPMPSAFRK